VEAPLIIRTINYALIGTSVGALFPVILWIVLFAFRHGVACTVEMLRDTIAAATTTRNSDLYLKTGALPGGILGLIFAPYLAPISARHMWRILEYLGMLAPFVEPGQLGAALVGLIAGSLGYLLRMKPNAAGFQ
jgi:hypothetical protein